MSHRTSWPAPVLAAGCLLAASPAAATVAASPAAASPAAASPAAASPAAASPAAASPAGATPVSARTLSPSTVSAAATPASAAAGRAWRTVTYRGVRLRVPASWPVVNLARHPRACPRLDVHAVYLGPPGPDPACPAGLRGKTAAVALQPVSEASPDRRQATRTTALGGRPAATNTNAAVTHTIIDILPAAGVQVSLSYGRSPRLVRAIQSTIAVSPHAHALALAAPAAITPAAPQTGVVKGPGFDTCAAPSAATMKHWLASPYRSVGIYIGGVNRACAQSSLTPAWIRTIQAQGWHYFPFYVGLQASCVAAFGNTRINPAQAAAQGRAAANDAVTQAADLGIPSGTPIIYDMEAYRGSCSGEVTTFLSAWDSQLHARGYVAGIYESFSNISDLVGAAGQMTEPDIIHYADWDGQATTTSPYMPSGMWSSHQRIHQYLGGHNETYGGTTVNIDNDQLDVTLSGTPSGGGGQRRPGFRIAIAINSNGSAEWFARAANGTIRHNYQYPVGTSGWSATRAVGNSPANLAGNPAVTANADGSLTLFARARGGKIVHAWQQAGAPNEWRWGGAAGRGRPPGGAVTSPAAIRAPGGEVAVFAGTPGGGVAWTQQRSPSDNTGWTAWAGLGGKCASSPVPFLTGRNKLAVFCRTSAGALAVDVAAEGGQDGWSGWQQIGGGPGRLTGTPAVVAGDGGQTEVFARTGSGQIGYAWQAPGGTSWTWGSSPAGGMRIKNSPTAAPWPGGGVGILAQQHDGRLGYAVQQGGGATGFGPWTTLSSDLLGSPTAWANANGQPEVAILNKQLQIAVSTFAGGQWSTWTQLGAGY
jgi:hypothetical protein